MKTTRVHVLSAVNAGAVSKYEEGGRTFYRVANVCGAVSGIVMNGMLYAEEDLAEGAPSLNGKPAPAGHPKDKEGRYISAHSGDAMLRDYAGAVCMNARHEGGRTLYDVVVNEAQAKAHPDGATLVQRLEAALNGQNVEPIHVSTGLYCQALQANGESMGKRYTKRATKITYDHSAFLLHEQGAGTPEQGVGMHLNAAGETGEVEAVNVAEALDRRGEGLHGWLRKLLGNETELSFEQIRDGLQRALGEGAWVREVFARSAVWTDRDDRMFEQPYTTAADGSVAFSGTATEVREERKYVPVNNLKKDAMKDMLIAALNSAGITTEGLSDAQLLAAYNAHVKAAAEAPLKTELAAANAKLQTLEANAQQAEQAELKTLAAELATNSADGLTAEHYAALGIAACRTLKANRAKAAPVAPGGAQPTGNASNYETLPE